MYRNALPPFDIIPYFFFLYQCVRTGNLRRRARELFLEFFVRKICSPIFVEIGTRGRGGSRTMVSNNINGKNVRMKESASVVRNMCKRKVRVE